MCLVHTLIFCMLKLCIFYKLKLCKLFHKWVIDILLNIKRNSFDTIMQLINPNYTSKIDSNEDFWKKLLQCCILYPIAKDLDHRVKMRHIEVFLFLLPFIIYLSEFDLISLCNFSKTPLMNSFDIFSLVTP